MGKSLINQQFEEDSAMQTEQLYLSIISNLRDGVYYVDINRNILFWNKAAENITGYSSDEIVGKSCQGSLLNHIDEEGHPLCITGCPLFTTLVDGQQRIANVFVRHKQGHRIPILVNIFPIYEDGEIIGAIEIFTQNSPKVYEDNLIERLSGYAMHDALTSLPNRRYLESFLEYKFSEYGRFGKMFAVMFADIDDFGNFNNQYGHDIGDAILINIASSIKGAIRNTDLVGRWGGEEFVGIYALSKESEAATVGEKFRQLVANTDVMYDESSLSVSVSVGITIAGPEDCIASIIERADSLMYQSKRSGKDQVTVK